MSPVDVGYKLANLREPLLVNDDAVGDGQLGSSLAELALRFGFASERGRVPIAQHRS